MIDSSSISTFTDKSIATKLKLPIIPKSKIISLANPDLKANITGEVTIDITLNNIKHNSVVVEVIDKLFIDIIIGKDILKKHKKSQKHIVGMFSYYRKFIKKFSDKIYPLNHNETFPLPPLVLNSIQILKDDLKNAMLVTVDYDGGFEVETDASDYCIAATLNQ